MPSYWVNKPSSHGNEPFKLPGVDLDAVHSIINIPLKPAGVKLDTHMAVEVGEGDMPKRIGQGLTADEVKTQPADTLWWIPDNATKFFPVPVKPLEDGGTEPLLDEEIDVMRTKIEWDMPGAPQGHLFTQAPVLSSIFVSLRQGAPEISEGPTITTKNDLFETLKHMGDKERTLVRERLKVNVTALSGKVEGKDTENPRFFASDLQFIFAMRLLDAAGDEDDRKQSAEFLDAVRTKVDDRLRNEDYLSDESPAHYLNLQQLLSSENYNEIYRGIGVLDKTSAEILYTLSRQTFEEKIRPATAGDVKVPTMAIQLSAACTRMVTKLHYSIE
jgi:hypothetical protein